MGEAFRRMRAATFRNQNSRAHQAMISAELLSASRETRVGVEIVGCISDQEGVAALAPGGFCLLRSRDDGGYDIVAGNIVVGTVSIDADDTVAEFAEAVPSAAGIVPCRVLRLAMFGGVVLTLDTGSDDE